MALYDKISAERLDNVNSNYKKSFLMLSSMVENTDNKKILRASTEKNISYACPFRIIYNEPHYI